MSEWQPIETAPKDCAVWIYSDNGMRHIAVSDTRWDWRRLGYLDIWEIQWPDVEKASRATHWMPLPEPPEIALKD